MHPSPLPRCAWPCFVLPSALGGVFSAGRQERAAFWRLRAAQTEDVLQSVLCTASPGAGSGPSCVGGSRHAGLLSCLGVGLGFAEGSVVLGGPVVTQEAKRKSSVLSPKGKAALCPLPSFLETQMEPDRVSVFDMRPLHAASRGLSSSPPTSVLLSLCICRVCILCWLAGCPSPPEPHPVTQM